MAPEDFDRAQLLEGARIEREHTDDPRVALKIAADHLAENPNYYRKRSDSSRRPLRSFLDDHAAEIELAQAERLGVDVERVRRSVVLRNQASDAISRDPRRKKPVSYFSDQAGLVREIRTEGQRVVVRQFLDEHGLVERVQTLPIEQEVNYVRQEWDAVASAVTAEQLAKFVAHPEGRDTRTMSLILRRIAERRPDLAQVIETYLARLPAERRRRPTKPKPTGR